MSRASLNKAKAKDVNMYQLRCIHGPWLHVVRYSFCARHHMLENSLCCGKEGSLYAVIISISCGLSHETLLEA